MQIVVVGDVEYEFPDDMPDEEIARLIRADQESQPETLQDIAARSAEPTVEEQRGREMGPPEATYADEMRKRDLGERVLGGLMSSFETTGIGLNELVDPLMNPMINPYSAAIQGVDEIPPEAETARQAETDARVREIRQARQEVPGYGPGALGGEIAQVWAPGSAGIKGARAAGFMRNTPRFRAAVSDTAASALHAGIQPTVDDESRLMNAYDAALWATGGGALGAAGSKVIKGANTSRIGQQVLDEGGYMTPGQASTSRGVKGLERFGQWVPFISGPAKELQAEGVADWAKTTLRQAAPEGTKSAITKGGHEGYLQLEKVFDEGYAAAWRTARKVDERTFNDIASIADQRASRMGKKDRRVLQNVVEDVRDARLTGGRKNIEELDDGLRNSIASSERNGELFKSLNEIRDRLRDQLTPEGRVKLDQMDADYGSLVAIREATAAAAEEGGEFVPGRLLQGSRAAGGTTRMARGTGPLQKWARESQETVGEKVGGTPILDYHMAMAAAAPGPKRLLRATGNAIIGQTGWQKALQGRLAEELARTGAVTGAMGAP